MQELKTYLETYQEYKEESEIDPERKEEGEVGHVKDEEYVVNADHNEHEDNVVKEGVWETLKKKLYSATVASLYSVQDAVHARGSSFELFGYDFMVDEAHMILSLK